MKHSTTGKGVKGNSRECKGVKPISRDQIVSTLAFDIFQPLTETKDTNDEINEISKGIDRLPDEGMHIGILTEVVLYILFVVKLVPEVSTRIDMIQDGNKAAKAYRGNDR